MQSSARETSQGCAIRRGWRPAADEPLAAMTGEGTPETAFKDHAGMAATTNRRPAASHAQMQARHGSLPRGPKPTWRNAIRAYRKSRLAAWPAPHGPQHMWRGVRTARKDCGAQTSARPFLPAACASPPRCRARSLRHTPAGLSCAAGCRRTAYSAPASASCPCPR